MDKIKEIRKILEKSSNPLFFYDDDPDGLVSYLLLKRKYKKGIGVIIRVRGMHGVDEDELYLRKIEENHPDVVVFLDKPTLTQEIFDKIDVKNKIWIDHHEPAKIKDVLYYNSLIEDKKNNPVSYICYQIVENDLWLAAVGVTADWSTALFKDFKKEYPEMVENLKGAVKPDDVLYNTKLGELSRRFSFMIKGKTKDVRNIVNLLIKIKDPYEILEKKSKEGEELYDKSQKGMKEYNLFLKKALNEEKDSGVLVFKYHSETMSYTSELANELIHRNPDAVVLVARDTEEQVRVSLRSGENGINIPKMLKSIFNEMEGDGGGHIHASAASIHEKDFNKFVEKVKKYVKE